MTHKLGVDVLAKCRALGLCMSTSKRERFGEVTSGNNVVFTVDGEETFKLIYDAISQAENSIYIAGYDLDPYLNFVRESMESENEYNANNHCASIDVKSNSCGPSSRAFNFV